MAINPELNVKLQLIDDMSPKLDKAKKNLEGFHDQLKSISSTLRTASQGFTVLGASITGPMILALNTTAKYSFEAKTALDNLRYTADKFQMAIGNAITPKINEFNNMLTNLYNKFMSIDPVLRTHIVQAVFMAGVYSLLLGVGLKVVNAFIKIVEVVAQIATVFQPAIIQVGKFVATNAGLFTMVGVILALVAAFHFFRDQVVPILNTIEIAALNVWLKFVEFGKWLTELITKLTTLSDVLIPFIRIFELTGQIPQNLGDAWINYLEAAKTGGESLLAGFENEIITIKQMIQDVKDNGAGSLVASFDQIDAFLAGVQERINGIKLNFNLGNIDMTGFQSGLTQMMENLTRFGMEFNSVLNQWMQQAQNLGQKTGQIVTGMFNQMSSDFGRAIGQMVVRGKNLGESVQEIFKSWAEMAIQKIVEVITQWVIMQTIGRMMAAASMAAAAAIASALTAMWTVPATLASIATMGGAAGAGSTSVITAMGVTKASAAAMQAVPMAEGGIVTKPTLALIGESGREAVIPLENNTNNLGVNVYIEKADFRKDQDVASVFNELVELMEQNRRAKI